MMPAARSCSRPGHAVLARIAVALGAALTLAALPGTARAQDAPDAQDALPGGFIIIPSECAQYWMVPGGVASPAGWNQFLSFTACMQDASIARIDSVDDVARVVDELQSALQPTLQLYIAAMEQGPGPVKIRAALHTAMAEAALMTRARSSIVAPPDLATNLVAAARYRALHDRLEPELADQARFVCTLVAVVDRAVAGDPGLAPDAITRGMLAQARRIAAVLRRRWLIPDDAVLGPRLAGP